MPTEFAGAPKAINEVAECVGEEDTGKAEHNLIAVRAEVEGAEDFD